MERDEGGRCKSNTRTCPKGRRHKPPHLSESSASRTLCRADDLGLGKKVIEGACFQSHQLSTPNPNPPPQPVTEGLKQPKVSATRKAARSKKHKRKPASATKPAAGKTKKKTDASVKTAVSTQIFTSTLEEISDFVDSLPLQACV